MSKKNQKKKSCKQKPRKGKFWIGDEYIIQYRSGERFVVLVACSFVCVCNIALSILFISVPDVPKKNDNSKIIPKITGNSTG